MLSDQFIAELGIALQAQHHILRKLDTAVAELDSSLAESATKLSGVSEISRQLKELEALMDELETDQAWLEDADFGDFDPDQILSLYKNRQQAVFRELTQIGFKDWDSFVRQCQAYALHQGIDPLAPYEALLTAEDLEKLKAAGDSYDTQYKWDKWDYMFVGASGVLACLTDFLLVQIPQKPSVIRNGKWFEQLNLTARLKSFNIKAEAGQTDWFSQWARELEARCKVPYDHSTFFQGMGGATHRFQSFGHDPVLGFVFGVLDIMRGTITGFSYDKLTQTHAWMQGAVWSNVEPVGLIEAILRQFGHLISDVATPMGLPAPFMTLIQGINAGSFGERKRTVGEVARWMYLNGYDFRHFLVSGITPGVIEIVLHVYIMLRHYSEHGELEINLASHPKYRSMLLMAHGIATLGNAGKIALMQGNPLAINYAEWMALIRYLVPSIKYWVFDQHRLRMDYLEQINTAEWDGLLLSSNRLLAMVAKLNTPEIILGEL